MTLTGARAFFRTLLPGILRALPAQRLRDARARVERLAAEITQIADSIQIDLAFLPSTTEIVELRARCASYRERAKKAARALTVDPVDRRDLGRLASQLHEEHWRVVNLRSDVDVRVASHNA